MMIHDDEAFPALTPQELAEICNRDVRTLTIPHAGPPDAEKDSPEDALHHAEIDRRRLLTEYDRLYHTLLGLVDEYAAMASARENNRPNPEGEYFDPRDAATAPLFRLIESDLRQVLGIPT